MHLQGEAPDGVLLAILDGGLQYHLVGHVASRIARLELMFVGFDRQKLFGIHLAAIDQFQFVAVL